MGDIQSIHNLWLTYGMYMSNGRHTEHSHFMVVIQSMSALWKMVRTPKTDKAQTTTTQVRLELILTLLLLQPSGKLRKTRNSNMENQNPRVPPLWEHSLTTLLGHDPTSDPGITLRQWIHFQGVHNILDILSWDREELKAVPAQQVYSLDDHGQGLYLSTNQIKQICGLLTYMKHVFGAYNSDIDPRDDPFHPFTT